MLNLGSNLIEAFQHLHHKFLVCRKCFCEFIRTYNINTFNRISLLRNQMYTIINKYSPSQVKQIQKQLLKFIER